MKQFIRRRRSLRTNAVLTALLVGAGVLGCRMSGLELSIKRFSLWPRGYSSEVITNGLDAVKRLPSL